LILILFIAPDVAHTNDLPTRDRNDLVKNPTTPPSSHGDSSESTLGSSDEAYSPVLKSKCIGHRASLPIFDTRSAEHKRTTSKQGMVNGSRLVLCCFMLCVLITNPFNYLLNLIHSSDYRDPTEMESIIGSRTLQSAVDHEHIRSSSKRGSLCPFIDAMFHS
jgi:hypothetical protein